MAMTDAQERIVELLDESGSRTKESLVSELEDEYKRTEVTRALGKLLVDRKIEEHPEINDAYRFKETD